MRLTKELGKGGEGSVFEVEGDPTVVAKLYHRPLSQRQRAKLARQMELSKNIPELSLFAAWPTVRLTADGSREGFLMPRIQGNPIHLLYRPVDRKQHFPEADWQSLIHVARNIAAAFGALHRSDIVMGDVNESNVLVTAKGEVRLIDCDSYQVPACEGGVHTCDVGVPMWTAPELQGKDFSGLPRSPDHDCFGLALLIFHLLFMGRHPFAGVPADRARMHEPPQLHVAIQGGMFAFSERRKNGALARPPHTLALSAVPPNLGELFERAFLAGVGRPRPSAVEWHAALGTVELKRCHWGHVFYRRLTACPWCEIWQSGGANFFFVATGGGGDISVEELSRLIRETRAFEPVTLIVPVRESLQMPAVVGRAFPADLGKVRAEFFVGIVLILIAVILVFNSPATILLWLILGGAGACLVSGGTENPKFKAEVVRRQGAIERANRNVNEILEAWRLAAETYRRDFPFQKDAALKALESLMVELRGLPEKRRKITEQRRHGLQLNEFLDRRRLERATIDGIGPKRMGILLANGIETALDAKRAGYIPGFGPFLMSKLETWVKSCEHQFRYDPVRPLSPSAQQEIDREMFKCQQDLLTKAHGSKRGLLELGARVKRDESASHARLDEAIGRLASAIADYRLIPRA